MTQHSKPPFPKQPQPMPGSTKAMDPTPDHGERSYKGSGRLAGKKAIITGGDSASAMPSQLPTRGKERIC